MIYIIVALIVGGLLFWLLNRNNPVPPPVDTEESLKEEGMTKAQIRRELRTQRAEYREAQRLRNNNIRVATKIGKIAAKALTKKR